MESSSPTSKAAPSASRWRRMMSPFSFGSRIVRAEEIPPASGVDSTAATGGDFAGPAGMAAKQEPPVQFELFSREWQGMSQQDNWDGFRIEAANQFSKYIQLAHTLVLGTQLRECQYIYQFGPAYQSEDARTMLVARAGLDGGINGRAIQKVGNWLELKASSNFHLKEAQRNMHEGSVELTGSEWTLGAKLAWQGAWLLGGAFSQRVLPRLHLGGDLTLVAVNGVTSIGQVGVRYSDNKDILVANVSRSPDPKSPIGASLHEGRLQYVRRLNERLSLGTEYKFSYPDKDSGLQLAYEYTFRNARVQGLLDTDGRVSCCVSDFTGIGFSGMIDYARSDYKFGFMMHVLPQPEPGQQ